MNVLALGGPRKMRVSIPEVMEDGSKIVWKPKERNESMIDRSKKGSYSGMIQYCNKKPVWVEGKMLPEVGTDS